MLFARALEEETVEAALVHAAIGGDRTAFGTLYVQHARAVHGILLAHVSYSDAEDLVQDVFVIALERIQILREPGAFGGWLAAIARNRAKDFHRRKKYLTGMTLLEQAATPEQAETFDALSAIRDLPECYRETLILRFVEGMTGPEIARRTGLTHDSVRVNLCRGMKLLREKLKGGLSHE